MDFIVVIVAIVIPATCVAIIANSKNRSAVGWFFYGVLVWPVALTHVIVAPRLNAAPANSGGEAEPGTAHQRSTEAEEKIVREAQMRNVRATWTGRE